MEAVYSIFGWDGGMEFWLGFFVRLGLVYVIRGKERRGYSGLGVGLGGGGSCNMVGLCVFVCFRVYCVLRGRLF